jgi:hypothetical protein
MVDAYLYQRGRQVLDLLAGQRGRWLTDFLRKHPELQVKATFRYIRPFPDLVKSQQIARGSYVIVEYFNCKNQRELYSNLQILSAGIRIASLADDVTYTLTDAEAKTVANVLDSFTFRAILNPEASVRKSEPATAARKGSGHSTTPPVWPTLTEGDRRHASALVDIAMLRLHSPSGHLETGAAEVDPPAH